MKKTYITPQANVIEMVLNEQVLTGSVLIGEGDLDGNEAWSREDYNTDDRHNKPNVWDQAW